MTTTSITPAQLRGAALEVAKASHPDQAGTIRSSAFARKSDLFAEVRMTGDTVLVFRHACENWVADRNREAVLAARRAYRAAMAAQA